MPESIRREAAWREYAMQDLQRNPPGLYAPSNLYAPPTAAGAGVRCLPGEQPYAIMHALSMTV